MRYLAIIAVMLLAGCLIDPTQAARCDDYRNALTAEQAQTPTDARTARIAQYTALIEGCP